MVSQVLPGFKFWSLPSATRSILENPGHYILQASTVPTFATSAKVNPFHKLIVLPCEKTLAGRQGMCWVNNLLAIVHTSFGHHSVYHHHHYININIGPGGFACATRGQTCKKCSTFLGSKISQWDVPQNFKGEKGSYYELIVRNKWRKEAKRKLLVYLMRTYSW